MRRWWGGGGASIKPPTITAPPPAGTIGASEIGNSPGLNLVAASHLYESGQRGTGNQIAVLDSGVDANHEELAGRAYGGGDWQGSGNGQHDPNGHGTHVASIAAAARNGSGIQGIAPDTEIVSYRILNENGIVLKIILKDNFTILALSIIILINNELFHLYGPFVYPLSLTAKPVKRIGVFNEDHTDICKYIFS